MSRHPQRQELARYYGATDIVEERGDAGVEKIKELTNGLGAHSVVEAVGTQESFMQAVGATRGGGHLGYVGVNYDVQIPGIELFFASIHTLGGPAPVRRFLPDLIDFVEATSVALCGWWRRWMVVPIRRQGAIWGASSLINMPGEDSGSRKRGRIERRGAAPGVRMNAGEDPVTGKRVYRSETISGADRAPQRRAGKTLTGPLEVDAQGADLDRHSRPRPRRVAALGRAGGHDAPDLRRLRRPDDCEVSTPRRPPRRGSDRRPTSG